MLYLIAYKPYGLLSQFSGENPEITLQALHHDFPRDVYPVGRLDKDSEGLLLLTNDRRVNHRLLDPAGGHSREYWAQVEGLPAPHARERLATGVRLNDGLTRPAQARLLAPEPELPPRTPPIRYRAQIPTAWIALTLTEGRNRQVRRMTAAVGHPTLRLLRWRIGPLTLAGLEPGAVRALTPAEQRALLQMIGKS